MQVALIGSGIGMFFDGLRVQTILFWFLTLAVSAIITFVVKRIQQP